MDTWGKYKKIKTNINLQTINISNYICYGNYLISKIAWKASQKKLTQRLVNKFFTTASIILQATNAQKGFSINEMQNIYEYIDQIYRDLNSNTITMEEIGLMLGNLSELNDANYTFTELIGFVRSLASKI